MATQYFEDMPHAEPEDDELDFAQRAKGKIRIAMIAVAVLVFGFLLAAATVPIGGAVIGMGRVGVESKVKRIAHPTGGVIAEIMVSDGDEVKAGDILMRLDTSVSAVNAEFSERSVEQLLAQRARLEAEREMRGGMSIDSELRRTADPSARAAIAAERRQLALNRSERASLRAQLSDRINQFQNQIEGYRAQISAKEQQKRLIAEELVGLRELREKGYATLRQVNEVERAAVGLDGTIGELQSEIARAQANISESRQQIISIDQQARAQAGEELSGVETALNQQRMQRAQAADDFERSVIRAPQDGIVDKLAYTTIGDVVRPAEPIMQIVPTADDLLIEAAISPDQVDQVRVGQNARVRFSAFSVNETPEYLGTVTYVSAELALDGDGNPSYYRVRVELDAVPMVGGRQLELVPGMPAEVFIETGSRSMLSYATKPLRDQFARAFRD